ncbi:MAG: hypothetical protein AAF297_09045 [Planctomycetota bacterium]
MASKSDKHVNRGLGLTGVFTLLGAAALVLAVWLALGLVAPAYLAAWLPHVYPFADAARIGEQFGAANALLSGAALLIVAAAMFVQMRTLRAIRADQTDVLRQQRDTAAMQAVLPVRTEIASADWVRAQRELTEWTRAHPTNFPELYEAWLNLPRIDRPTEIEVGTTTVAASEIDPVEGWLHTVLGPFRTIERLCALNVISAKQARVAIGHDEAWTLHFIALPLDHAVRPRGDHAEKLLDAICDRSETVERARARPTDGVIESTGRQYVKARNE